jgi:outer membrane autotransporter protein
MSNTQNTDQAEEECFRSLSAKSAFCVRGSRFSRTLLSCALALAALPLAASAYDGSNPFAQFTVTPDEINTYEFPNLLELARAHYEEPIVAYLTSEYSFPEDQAVLFARALLYREDFPEGINLTVNGTLTLENQNAAVLWATSNLVFNGASDGGRQTALNLSGKNLSGNAKDVFVNGDILVNRAELDLKGTSSLTVTGNITADNSSVEIKSPGTLLINGNITLRDTAGEGDRTVQLRYYSFDYDRDAEVALAIPYYKNYSRDTSRYLFHGLRMDDWLYMERIGYVVILGDEIKPVVYEEGYDEQLEPKAPASVKLNGNITVENTYNSASSVRLTLTGDGTDWSWKGSATMSSSNTPNASWKGPTSMTGSDCPGCAQSEQGIFVYAQEGAVWQVEGADSTKYTNFNKVSSISRWTSYGRTVIDMTKTPDTMLLTIDELVGNGTVIREKVDPNHTADGNLTDMVVLGGRSRGEHTVELHSTGAEPMEIRTGRVPYLQVTVPCTLNQARALTRQYQEYGQGEGDPWLFLTEYREQMGDALKLSTEDSASGEGRVAHIQIDGIRTYKYFETGERVLENFFTLTHDFPELIINYGNLNNELDVGTRKYKIFDPVVQPDGSVMFYIEMEGMLPDGTPVPTSELPFSELSTGTELVTTLAGDGAMYSAWMADLSDLRKRLGEVRYGAQDGLWVKGIAQKDKIKGMTGADFKQKLYGLQLGLDHIVTQDEDRMWLLGANFKYNTVEQKVDAMRYGKGDLKTYGAFLYATYADYKGYYTDLVLSLDHYKQKMTAEQTDSSYVHGKYNTWGWGASVEVGKMFSSAQDDEGWGPWYSHWWVEPQAQLAYYWVNGKKFSMDNGMTVRQKNGDSLIGRLGLVVGKKFNYGKNRKEVDKRYSQFYLKGGVKHEFLGSQTVRVNNDTFNGKLRGTRVYYGAGFDWNVTDRMRLYAQVERESGSKYKKDYEVSVGLKWQF